jgi:hypothetical protein
VIEIINCEQNSDDWLRARMGIPTSSMFGTVMAKGEGKTRSAYMLKLAGEILTGNPMQNYTNDDTERGHIQEPEARTQYVLETENDPECIGFIRNGKKGASPDSLIAKNGGLEIKCCQAHIQIDRLNRDELPTAYRAQVQGCLWVAEREWWDFVSYCPRLPIFIKRVYRDDAYIKNLAVEVHRFNAELDETVEAMRNYRSPYLAEFRKSAA